MTKSGLWSEFGFSANSFFINFILTRSNSIIFLLKSLLFTINNTFILIFNRFLIMTRSRHYQTNTLKSLTFSLNSQSLIIMLLLHIILSRAYIDLIFGQFVLTGKITASYITLFYIVVISRVLKEIFFGKSILVCFCISNFVSLNCVELLLVLARTWEITLLIASFSTSEGKCRICVKFHI